ncbi:LysR family transcriptional regulator [Imbroritus primus]|uniref:LysR family transcriptional regulator n=1 Tax=Imbroritus primus TaxID=3058603 RepID=A0ACD3SNY2_9BURK|nr:LysR family transcriptional regulator [Burkholderiaceae bacterium PBA]
MQGSDLTLLVDIVDAGNLSAAARRLKLSRSSLSYRLKALERAVGAQLFKRTTRSLELTEVGRALHAHGQIVARELAAAHATVSSLGKSLHGKVSVSVPTGFGQVWLNPLLIDFKRRHPGVTLNVVFDNQITDLVSEDIDIAIRVLSRPPESLVATDLGKVDWVLCATPAYLAANPPGDDIRQLQHARIICAAAVGQPFKLIARSHLGNDPARLEIRLVPEVQSENFAFLRDATLASLGLGILPRYVVAEQLRNGTLLRLFGDHELTVFGSHVFMLTLPSRYRTQATRQLMTWLRERIKLDDL